MKTSGKHFGLADEP